MSRYESLLNRCQAATKAVDELDLLRLQKSSANTSKNENEDVNVEDVIDVDDGDEDERPEICVIFAEHTQMNES